MPRTRERQPSALEVAPPSAGGRFTPRRWWAGAALVLLTLAAAWMLSGGLFPLVLWAWLQALLFVPIIIAGGMLGLLLTRPLTGAFENTGWPDMARLILSIALGLGALSLSVLLAGSIHLLYGFVMLVLLVAAGAAGFTSTRDFIAHFNREMLKAPAGRGLLILMLAAVPLAMLMIATTYPPGVLWPTEGNGYDVLEYHLQLPREYLALHSTSPLGHNVYSYLPANVEMLYLMLMGLSRIVFQTRDVTLAVLPSGMLHAFLAVLAAGAVALVPVKISPFGRGIAFVMVLAIPWTIVTGSLAYNDAGVLLYGALAIGLALHARTRGMMITIGILLGLAVGCKMTAGVMIALPVAGVLIARGRLRGLLLATLLSVVVYSPWAIRSMVAAHTPGHIGNPVFPIAAQRLGMDHWTPEQADAWTRGHSPPTTDTPLLSFYQLRDALETQIFFDPQWSPNYVGVEKWSGNPPSGAINEVTRILGRIGLLWFILPIALVAALITGKMAWRLLLVLGIQLTAWLMFTHLQARFFLPGIIPLALLFAISTQRLATVRILVSAVVGLQAVMCGFLLLPAVFLGPAPNQPAAWLVDGMELPGLRLPDGYFNKDASGASPPLPDNVSTYLVGQSRALLFHGTVYYHTVWDVDPFVETFKNAGPAAAVDYLRRLGVQYVVVDWNEIRRLGNTYGFDKAVTPAMFAQMETQGLKPVVAGPDVVLYEVK